MVKGQGLQLKQKVRLFLFNCDTFRHENVLIKKACVSHSEFVFQSFAVTMFGKGALYDDKMDYFVKNNQKSKIDCKACKKPFISILQHLKKSKNCGSTYTQEEMDSLNRISKEISRQKLSDTQIRYYRRNKGKIGERSAKNYLENKGKKYEVGIGQGIVKALHDDDIQKHDAVKEWVEIFKKETVKHHARTSMDNLKHIEQTFKYPSTGDYFTKRKKMIPLKIDYPVAQIPSVVKLLKFIRTYSPKQRPWDHETMG